MKNSMNLPARIGILCIIITSCISCVKTVESLYISEKEYEVIKFNTMMSINGMHFMDDNYGFVVGDSGLVFKTTNGGKTWEKKSLGEYYLNGVHFCSNNDGYIVGTNQFVTSVENTVYIGDIESFIFRTINGGETWEITSLGKLSTDNVVFCINKEKAVITTGHSIFYTNDGLHWDRVPYDFLINDYVGNNTIEIKPYDFTDIIMPDDSTILLLGTNKSIITTDFFKSWKDFSHKSNSLSSFLDNKSLLSTHKKSIYYSLTDTTWNLIRTIDEFDGEDYNEIEDIEGINDNYFFVVAGKRIHRTNDGGISWETIIPREGLFHKLMRTSENYIFGLGSSSTYYLNKGSYQYVIKIKI